jgi:hypothetical protein
MVMGLALPAVAQVDQQRAQEFFKEVQALCERDGGRLWGVSLCGPMVIGDVSRGGDDCSRKAPLTQIALHGKVMVFDRASPQPTRLR